MASQNELGVVANFYSQAVENPAKSRTEGRPIFDDVDMVRLRYVGDKTRELHAPAADKFIREKDSGNWLTYADVFADQYKAYKAGQEYTEGGTPLSEVPFLTEAKRQELRALNVYTLEHIVANEDRLRKALGMSGGQILAQARAMMERARDSALETKLAAENDALKQQLESLSSQVQQLMAGAKSAPVSVADDDVDEGPFSGFSDDDLKAYIKDQSGQAPRGQPSRATLLRMADELAAKIRESA